MATDRREFAKLWLTMAGLAAAGMPGGNVQFVTESKFDWYKD